MRHSPGNRPLAIVRVVVEFPNGALVALIDGLGHGNEASAAAIAAERVLLSTPYEAVDELVRRCHEQLRRTRGAVLSLASFDTERGAMTWLGVGNVEALLVRAQSGASEAVSMRGGTSATCCRRSTHAR